MSADHVYMYDSNAGRVAVSSDGGSSFAITLSGLPTAGGEIKAVPEREGHWWLPAGDGGLYRSTNYGGAVSKVAGLDAAWRLGLGRAKMTGGYPAIYVWGRRGEVSGFWRSDDEGGPGYASMMTRISLAGSTI